MAISPDTYFHLNLVLSYFHLHTSFLQLAVNLWRKTYKGCGQMYCMSLQKYSGFTVPILLKCRKAQTL